LRHLFSYAEYQFGDRVPGKPYRERSNCDRIDNWEVEIEILAGIGRKIYNTSNTDESLSVIDSGNLRMPYLLKMHNIYLPYIQDKDLVNGIFKILSLIDRDIALIYMKRNESDMAKCYCQQALSHARLCERSEDEKVNLINESLMLCCDLEVCQKNYVEALSFAEEAYILVSTTYNPVHPKVLLR
jgi:hypothetical protein